MSMITGEANIKWMQMRTQLSALELEVKGVNFGRSVYQAIKRTYGLRGSRVNVYNKFKQMVEDARPADLAGSYDLCRQQLSRI